MTCAGCGPVSPSGFPGSSWRGGCAWPAGALPATLRAQLAFAPGERTLLAGRDPDGGYALVATDRALHHRTGRDGWSRLGWEQLSSLSWEAAPGRLVITGLTGAAPPRTIVPLRDRGTWPELAEERITHTKLNRQHVILDGGQRVVVEVRRCPGTGELRWALVSGRNLDPGDQDLRNQIERAATRQCADLGLAESYREESKRLRRPGWRFAVDEPAAACGQAARCRVRTRHG